MGPKRNRKKKNAERKSDGKSPAELKQDLLIELRNIILYRHDLSQPTATFGVEEAHKKILAFAGAVYHFKDRMLAWCRKNGILTDPPLDRMIESSQQLLVCGDLFNEKKHGGCENRSGLSPYLSGMTLATAGEPVGIYYDGQMKTGTVSRVVPYTIEIWSGENVTLGNAVPYISQAFCRWMPVLTKSGFLVASDPTEARLLAELELFCSDRP